MTYLYTNLTETIPPAKTKAITVARILFEHLVASYCIAGKVLTENGSQFVSKFSVAVSSTVGGNNVTTTQYYPQTSSRTERSTCNQISRLGYYVLEQQMNWNTNLLPLTYGHNIEIHRSIDVFSFRTALTRTTTKPATKAPRDLDLATEDATASSMYDRLKLIKYTTNIRQESIKNLRKEQKRYERDYDRAYA